MYKLHEFVDIMHQNNFLLSMIVTAKPLIADLVFQPKSDLISSNFMITNYFSNVLITK